VKVLFLAITKGRVASPAPMHPCTHIHTFDDDFTSKHHSSVGIRVPYEFPMQSSPKAPKPLAASSALYAGSAVATRQEHASATPAASGMIGIGAIILKTPLGLRVIKLRPTGGAFASGKVGQPAASTARAQTSHMIFQVRVGDIILEVEGNASSAQFVDMCLSCNVQANLLQQRRRRAPESSGLRERMFACRCCPRPKLKFYGSDTRITAA
jgi:hypothetical protein